MSTQMEFLLYSLPDDEGKVQVVVRDETLWRTQMAMAQLFGIGVPAVSKHLSKEATVSKMEIVQKEAGREVKRATDFYNLDAIIAVGYRVSSLRATRFRQVRRLITKNNNQQ